MKISLRHCGRNDLNVIGDPEHEIVWRYEVRCDNTHCDCSDLALVTHHCVSWSLFITTSLYGFLPFTLIQCKTYHKNYAQFADSSLVDMSEIRKISRLILA